MAQGASEVFINGACMIVASPLRHILSGIICQGVWRCEPAVVQVGVQSGMRGNAIKKEALFGYAV